MENVHVKPTTFLRIASVLTLIHCAGHTVGGVFGKPSNGAEEIAVIETMKSHVFNVMGSMRTYWDFFFGYGMIGSINMLIQGILFWMLASYVKANPGAVRMAAALFCINFVGTSIIAFRYFFVAPGVMEVLIAVCLAAAYFTTAVSA
jgi:hypothetical protein